MPLHSKHRSYTQNARLWRKIRDVLAGEDTIKAAGERYLPRLGGQTRDDYQAYLSRSFFYNAAARTAVGLVGAIFRKAPRLNLPEALTPSLDSITADGRPFVTLAKELVGEVIAMGRCGVLVDAPRDGGQPYLIPYTAEQIINWSTALQDGQQRVGRVVLWEMVEEATDDIYVPRVVSQYRVLDFNADGHYQQSLYRRGTSRHDDDYVLIDRRVPTWRGQPLTRLPFIFMAPTHLAADVEKSPLLDLVNVNLSHYRSLADLEHGRHFTALPTPWITAPTAERGAAEYSIGPGNVWLLEPGGQAGMLEFRGAGLAYLESACRDKERMMAVLGARLLDEQKTGVEATETVRLRQAGEQSFLASLADTCGRALTEALRLWAMWQGEDAQKISLRLNSDFDTTRLSSDELRELIAAWQAGAIDTQQLQNNLTQGEVA